MLYRVTVEDAVQHESLDLGVSPFISEKYPTIGETIILRAEGDLKLYRVRDIVHDLTDSDCYVFRYYVEPL